MRAPRERHLYVARRIRTALPSSRPTLPDEDAAFESRLVWILGSPRTGSSWLLRLLIHPLRLARVPSGVSAPPSVGRRERPSVVPVNESHVCRHLTPMTREPQPRLGADDDENFLKRGLQDHVSYLFADHYADAWRPKARELVLARMRAQAEAGARQLGLKDPLVVIKEPQSSGADSLMSLLPRSRLLFLVRDGREVVRSMLALYGPGGRLEDTSRAPEKERASRRAFVERQSKRWVKRMASVQAAFDAHDLERRIMVRYEDLTRETPAELHRITAWMGLRRSDAQIRAAVEEEQSRTRPSESGRRTKERDPSVWELAPDDREVADEVMGPMLSELGYRA